MVAIFLLSVVVVAVPLILAGLSVRLEKGSADEVRRRQQAPSLAEQMPWWVIEEDGAIIGTDLRYSMVFALEGVDTDCMAIDELEQCQQQIHTMLVSLPAGVRLQYIHLNDHDNSELIARYTAQVTADNPCAVAVKKARVEKLANSPRLRRSRLYLCVTLPHSEGAFGFSTAKPFEKVNEAEHEDKLLKLHNLSRQIVGAMRSASVECRALIRDEARSLIYEFLNPQRARQMPVPPGGPGLEYSEQQTMREKLCLSDVTELSDSISLDGQLIRVLTMRGLPTATDPALLEGLTVGIPFSCRIQLTIEITEDQKSLDVLKRKRNKAQVQMEGVRRNQEAEAAANDIEDLIDQNLASAIRMTNIGLSVVLSVDESKPGAKELLEYQTVETLRLLTVLNGCQGMVETYAQLDSWLATLPANGHHRVRGHLCTSINASHLALQYQGWPGHHHASILLEDSRNHLISLDPFDSSLDNPNAFIAGVAGSGKSVTTNYLLMHLFAGETKGLVIDIGGSYKRLLSLYGGEYFTFDDPDAAINLFYEPVDVVMENGDLEPMRMRFMIAVLEALFAEPTKPSLSHEEITVLERSIKELYVRSTTVPILSDLQLLIKEFQWDDEEDAAIARKMSRSLRRWTEGAHAKLLNRPGSVNLSSGCAGFDLKGLAEEVQAPVLLILSGTIWNLVKRNREEKKVVVFDEVWKLLKSPTACELIEELYRTSRKYRASIVAISQSVEDFVDSPVAAALTNNSSTTYLLRHRTGHEIVGKVFNLNEREVEQFRGLEMRRGEYSEVLVLSGDRNHAVVRVVLSPLEYWIATTHPADLAFKNNVLDSYPSWDLFSVLAECARLAPQGAEALPQLAAAAA